MGDRAREPPILISIEINGARHVISLRIWALNDQPVLQGICGGKKGILTLVWVPRYPLSHGLFLLSCLAPKILLFTLWYKQSLAILKYLWWFPTLSGQKAPHKAHSLLMEKRFSTDPGRLGELLSPWKAPYSMKHSKLRPLCSASEYRGQKSRDPPRSLVPWNQRQNSDGRQWKQTHEHSAAINSAIAYKVWCILPPMDSTGKITHVQGTVWTADNQVEEACALFTYSVMGEVNRNGRQIMKKYYTAFPQVTVSQIGFDRDLVYCFFFSSLETETTPRLFLHM